VLRGGVLFSAALIIIGMVLMWITGDTSNPFCVIKPGWMIWGNPFLEPSHVLFLGFAVLIITPMLRVAVSMFIYLKTHDLQLAAITIIVFLILILSMTFGIG
jgi:uncharacterized membrane protein